MGSPGGGADMWVCHVEGCSFSPGTRAADFPNLGPPTSGLLVSLACDFSYCLGFPDRSVQASLIACSLEEKL